VNSKNRTVVILISAIVLIAGLAAVALLLSGGDDSNESSVPAPVATDAMVKPLLHPTSKTRGPLR